MPKFRPPNRGRRAAPITLSAPTGGLNGRDSFTDMPPNDAFVLENWFPNLTSVDTRNGSLNFGTGLPGPVESLEVYTGAAGSKMLAFSNGGVYDVSLGGAVGAPLASGKLSNKLTSCMFSNAGAQFLLLYSGSDAPLSYDGTTLTALAITGLTGSQNLLFCGHAFKGRMFLGQAGQLGFYYLAVGAIQGAASFFDLQQQSVRGGSLSCITSFSQEGTGVGPQDYAVFVTTEGEYIMYAGTDPSNAATWSLVGRYYGPPPIGKKSWFKFRSDVYFVTAEGVLSLTQIRRSGEEAADTTYLTSKLGRNYTDIATYEATHGWSGMIYPRGHMVMVNLPITSGMNGQYAQFVMNTNSNAWGKFTGWNAVCWGLFKGRAYFGTYTGKVVLADEGFTDNGTQVLASARQAWNALDDANGMGEADKQFHFVTLALKADGAPAISGTLNVNYEDDRPMTSTALGTPSGTSWDVATWDLDDWAGAPGTQNVTIPVGKLGYIASLWMTAASVASNISWYATRIIFEKTRGVLLQ